MFIFSLTEILLYLLCREQHISFAFVCNRKERFEVNFACSQIAMKLKKRIRKEILLVLDSAPFEVGERLKSVRKIINGKFEDEFENEKEFEDVFQISIDKLITKGLVFSAGKYLKKSAKADHVDLDSTKRKRNDEETTKKEKDSNSTKKQKSMDSPLGTEYNEDEKAVVRTAHDSLKNIQDTARSYPVNVTQTQGQNTILLFYAYCSPQMTRAAQDQAISFCMKILNENGVTGRLRVGREGFNGTLTGPFDGVRAFTAALRKFDPSTFSTTDFKYVDNQPDSQLLKGLKVWPVTEIVTYGFDPAQAPLDMRGTHLKPEEFHEALASPNSVVIDVRNFNETLIGKFAPPAGPGSQEKVLDPCMRRSTEFPQWVQDNKQKLEGKQVLMYCTGGVRCERASAFMRFHGVENVYQLDGGIHRYLEAFPDDGGFWVGKNYTFDKRFSHGAKVSTVISSCVACSKPWDRYQAQKKCFKCAMEVLLCKDCQRAKPPPAKETLFCPLCSQHKSQKKKK